MENPNPGWYDDPSNSAQKRYWDGVAWTAQTRPTEQAGPADYSPPSTPPAPTFQGFANQNPSASYGAQAQSLPPSNYLVFGILTTIFCCLPLGIVSIIFSSKVNSLWSRGDFEGAFKASVKAKRYALFALIAGVISVIAGVMASIFISTMSEISSDVSTTAITAATTSTANIIATDANFKAIDNFNGVVTPDVLGAAYFDYYGPNSLFPDRESALLNTASCLEVTVDDLTTSSLITYVSSVYIDSGMAFYSELGCF